MRRFTCITSLATVSILMGGCNLLPGGAEPQATAPVVVKTNPNRSLQKPVVVQKSKTIKTTALIQPTNPDERLRVVKSGRRDPFASVVPSISPSNASGTGPSPSGTVPANASGTGSSSGVTVIAQGPQNPGPSETSPFNVFLPNPGSSNPGLPNPSSSGTNGPSRTASTGTPESPNSEIQLPALPQPDLAKAVQVTGVVLLGGVPKAIVKSPNEAATRYVSVGDRLENGQVLVKLIEMNASGEPSVTLEQYGIDVVTTVGKATTQVASAL